MKRFFRMNEYKEQHSALYRAEKQCNCVERVYRYGIVSRTKRSFIRKDVATK